MAIYSHNVEFRMTSRTPPTGRRSCYVISLHHVNSHLLPLAPQSTITLDGGALVQVQKWDGKSTTIKRKRVDDKLVVVSMFWRPDPPAGHLQPPFRPNTRLTPLPLWHKQRLRWDYGAHPVAFVPAAQPGHAPHRAALPDLGTLHAATRTLLVPSPPSRL